MHHNRTIKTAQSAKEKIYDKMQVAFNIYSEKHIDELNNTIV